MSARVDDDGVMGEDDREMLASFAAVTGEEVEETSVAFLKAAAGDLEFAISMYYDTGGDATQLEMTQPSAEDAEMARNIAEYVLAQGGFEGGFEDGFEGFGDPDALDMYGEDADGWGEAAVGVGFGFDAEFDDTGFEAMSVHDNIQRGHTFVMEADQCDPDDVVEIADLLRSAETAFRAALDSAIEACMPTDVVRLDAFYELADFLFHSLGKSGEAAATCATALEEYSVALEMFPTTDSIEANGAINRLMHLQEICGGAPATSSGNDLVTSTATPGPATEEATPAASGAGGESADDAARPEGDAADGDAA